jgi:LacI family transcriptional regulator
VREETRQRVLATIKELNFSPNSAARQLSGGKTFTIGVVSPFFTFPSFVERLAGIQDVLDMSSYDLVLYSIRAPEQIARRLHTVITQNRADGLIILALPFDDEQVWLADPTLPIVVVDNVAVERYPSVVIDDIAGGQLATQYLIQQGHSTIGFIGDLIDNPFGFTSTRNRFAGFKQALADADLSCNPDWCRFGQHSQEAARHSAHAILSRAQRPTALFVSIDTLALGVMAAATDLGLRIPDDVAIIGFDDVQAAGYSGLTTVRQHLFCSGQIAAQAMLDWLAYGSLPADRWRTYMSLEIIERSTV